MVKNLKNVEGKETILQSYSSYFFTLYTEILISIAIATLQCHVTYLCHIV